MAGVKISDLTNAPVLDGSEIIPVVKSGANLSILIRQLNNHYTLEQFGAVGDGVTDDTEAFQDCIDAMPDSTSFGAGGGILMLAGKTYLISSTIVIQKSIKIIGAGADSGTRILLKAGSDCNMLEIGKRNSSDPISVTLDGIRIQGRRDQADGFSNVVTYNYVRHCHFIDLFCVNATAPNFLMTTDAGQEPGRNNYFYGCAFEYGKVAALKISHNYNLNINSSYFGFGLPGQASYGLYVSQGSTRFLLANSWFLTGNRNSNMYITGTNYGHIVNNHFNAAGGSEVLGSAHLYMGTVNDITVANNILNNSLYPYNVFVGAGAERVRLYNNKFGTSATQPFYFGNKANILCRGNIVGDKLQENNGAATIANGDTHVDVTHGIFTNPDNVVATPQGDEGVWVDTVGATTFRINRALSVGDLVCNWMASVKTY